MSGNAPPKGYEWILIILMGIYYTVKNMVIKLFGGRS